ncbi:MAG TPA: histidine--tRNA ligase [Candidatus Acidoferrales bacterium]|nr:histidine--tRNA ligase [Candidatus Acidoferrales bacterium]
MKFQAVKGTRDILPPESALWNRVEQVARDVFASYNFGEILLPVFEQTELFARSIGEATDVVAKEMYTFFERSGPHDGSEVLSTGSEDAAAAEVAAAEVEVYQPQLNVPGLRRLEEALVRGLSVSLRPEATASVVRAYIEHGMQTLPGDVKLYYMGPMFRRERPQKGRYRQFYQIGAEVLGQSDHPGIDADVIEMVLVFIERCGLVGHTLFINSIGCRDCRPKYVELLRAELTKVKDRLGPDSQRRIETNPLRVLDSKLESEQAIIESLPRIGDHLCEACREHFKMLQAMLFMRQIAYEVNWRLVRGLDYYMRTTFEITAPGLGAQNAICGGGRYDGLVELLGGPPTKGIGFALGTDRLILALQEAGKGEAARPLDAYVAWMGASTYAVAVRVARTLRDAGFSVEMPHEEMKFKKSLGLAGRLGARFAVILGDNEVAAGTCTVKRMADGTQQTIAERELAGHLRTS